MNVERLLKEIEKRPPEVALEALRLALRSEFQRSLYLTCRFLMGYRDINWHTHGGAIEILEDPSILRKLLVMPRGTLKSSLLKGYCVWSMLRNPNIREMWDSHKFEHSCNEIKEIRNKLQDRLITLVFGEFKSDETWSTSEITIRQRTAIKREATLTASGIGANKVGSHFDLMIHDDMNTDKNSGTPELRKKIIDHYKLNTAILDPGGIIVVCGTRYAADDLIGWIIENQIGEPIDRAKAA